MTKRIIANIQPFVFEQKVYLFEDDMLKSQLNAPMADLAEKIVKFCYMEETGSVSLQGDPHFTEKIKEEILASELSMYSINQIQVETL